MADGPHARISARKQPQQARSAGLVAAVLEAASQVLARDGAGGFTTARVAERAGVSIGSVYQYFPNKAAILFRLQAEEWRRTAELLCSILEDDSTTPETRLRALCRAFLRSECEEAALRTALNDAAPLYRGAPEARTARASGDDVVRTFLRASVPGIAADICEVAADLLTTMLSAVGKRFSAQPRAPEEVDAQAGHLADLLCAYLDRLRDRSGDRLRDRATG